MSTCVNQLLVPILAVVVTILISLVIGFLCYRYYGHFAFRRKRDVEARSILCVTDGSEGTTAARQDVGVSPPTRSAQGRPYQPKGASAPTEIDDDDEECVWMPA